MISDAQIREEYSNEEEAERRIAERRWARQEDARIRAQRRRPGPFPIATDDGDMPF